MGTRIGLLRKSSRADDLAIAQRDAMAVIDRVARNREEHEFLRARVGAAAALETSDSRAAQLTQISSNDFDSVETYRLARVILNASDSNTTDKARAQSIAEKWSENNLTPRWHT